ncbi:hypothetical protein C8R47DRAFT_1166845 [Mycena vitilis]|nr:hypothetical protein C8R47DRAFT_1166845 [Mycena vitilis]
MLDSKDFSAWVSIEGVEAPEYGPEVSENQQDYLYGLPPESEVGKNFTVNWMNRSVHGLTGGGVQVDGHKRVAFMDGIPETDTKTSRPFVFAPLELTDDDAYLESASHPHLGLIRLEIWRVDVGLWNGPYHSCLEHALVQSAQIRRGGSGPLVTFSFKYRSLDLLRANGIAEPAQRPEKRKASATPEPEASTEEGACDAEEAAKLRERIATLTAKRRVESGARWP